MSRPRAHISLKTKLAATLCQMVRPNADGEFEPVIPHDEAKRLSESEILARFDFHHAVDPHALGGSDHHSNLVPMLRSDHRERTAKIDIPAIAKSKRLTREQERFRATVTAKSGQGEAPAPRKSKWPSRPFPKRAKRKEA